MTEKIFKRGIGTAIRERLAAGDTNDQALETVKIEFPASNTSKATVSWYRNQLRKQGEKIPTAAEARKVAPEVDPLD